MATKTETKTAATKVEPKGTRPQAVLNDLDLSATLDEDEFPVTVRRSKWTELLDKLYAATEADEIPRGEDESLKFVRLGSFTNPNGARTQMQDMNKKGLGETYEFKAISKSTGSELWGRVIEVADEE